MCYGVGGKRRQLTFLSQDAQCFEGTLRDNLDPTARASDLDLWQALENSGLKSHAEVMGGLDAHVDEGGSNLSAGQRQVCAGCLFEPWLQRADAVSSSCASRER